jgi:hypothetical protein
MDILEVFLRENGATLIIPLLSKLNIPVPMEFKRGAPNEIEVYLPDDVAIRYLAEHINVSVDFLFTSTKFIQMLQYGVKPDFHTQRGWTRGIDEEGRATIGPLAVLASVAIKNPYVPGYVTHYYVIDGILGKDDDIQQLSVFHTWLKLSNDVFRNLVRTNHIKGEHLLTLCSSNRALSAKCDNNNELLFKQLLIDEFGLRGVRDARVRYAQIYRDLRIFKSLLGKVKLFEDLSKEGGYNEDMPDDLYDLLYSSSDYEVGFIKISSYQEQEGSRLKNLLDQAETGISILEELRGELGRMDTHGLKRDIYVYFEIFKQYRPDLVNIEDLLADVGNDNEDVEDKLLAVEEWAQNFSTYLREKNMSDADARKKIQRTMDENREFLEDEIEEADMRFRNTGRVSTLTQEKIENTMLEEDEIDLLLRIHHAIIRGLIDASYIIDENNEGTLLQIVSHLE